MKSWSKHFYAFRYYAVGQCQGGGAEYKMVLCNGCLIILVRLLSVFLVPAKLVRVCCRQLERSDGQYLMALVVSCVAIDVKLSPSGIKLSGLAALWSCLCFVLNRMANFILKQTKSKRTVNFF